MQGGLVLDVLSVDISSVSDEISDQVTLWTLLIRQVPPKWFERWMLAPAVTRALIQTGSLEVRDFWPALSRQKDFGL